MQSDYKSFVDRLINKYEGGYTWDKGDPGGPTKYGITCYDLAEHRGEKMVSMAEWAPLVRALQLPEAETIYQTKYATYINFNALPAGVDCCVMDYAVNSGVARGALVTRTLIGIHGSGPLTSAECSLIKDSKKFIDDMCAERLKFMHGIKGGAAWAEFGHGWGARVSDLQSYCRNLATGSAAPAPVDLSNIATPKAAHEGKSAAIPTISGTVASGMAAHQAGAPWWGVVLIVAGVIGAGLAYEFYSEHQAAKANATV